MFNIISKVFFPIFTISFIRYIVIVVLKSNIFYRISKYFFDSS